MNLEKLEFIFMYQLSDQLIQGPATFNKTNGAFKIGFHMLLLNDW